MKALGKWLLLVSIAMVGVMMSLLLAKPVFAEEQMPDLNDAKLILHQKRELAGFCDKENEPRPLYIEVYFEANSDENKTEKQLLVYFESEEGVKPSIIAEGADGVIVIVYADFDKDGIVDETGAPGDPKIGEGSCDTLYNLRSQK